MMKKVHFFYPENDLALASDRVNYTAPKAAQCLRMAGEALPLWYGARGDEFICAGISDRWLAEMQARFDIGVDIFHYRTSGFVPAPWGWSKTSRKIMADYGFPAEDLPSDIALERMRQLSHRRTASEISRQLAASLEFPVATAAEELMTPDEIDSFLRHTPDAMLKLPWSSSGRGLMRVRASELSGFRDRLAGVIGRQGSVMAEPYYDRRLADFAMLYEMEAGVCTPCGFSRFSTTEAGAYSGNVLASDSSILDGLASVYPQERLEVVQSRLCSVLEGLIGQDYSGPLGVDMMIVEHTEGKPLLVACVEMNLRMTMGHLARRFHDRFMRPEAMGRFTVEPVQSAKTDYHPPEVFDSQLVGGCLDLVPQNPYFCIRAEIL